MDEMLSAKMIVDMALRHGDSLNSVGVFAARQCFDDPLLMTEVTEELTQRSPNSVPAFEDTKRKLLWLHQ